jgi:hypothetical protein
MTAIGIILFEALACLGIGGMLLRISGIGGRLMPDERLSWAFALGLGGLGWLLFFPGIAGWFTPGALFALLAVSCLGVLGLCSPLEGSAPPGRGIEAPASSPQVVVLVLAGLALILGFDFIEGLAPPADADSLAYHFALPKQFVAAGRIEFVPRAVDGAAPMLVQMTYVPALSLGGERALTLWTMVSGWASAALLYGICRRFLPPIWSLGTALVWLGTPAVLYGAGSGQVEIRNGMFVMCAAFSVLEARRTGFARYALLAGMATGFFMATKYLGLLFAVAAGLTILVQRRWFLHGALFGLAALVAGGQWYAWNWLHTGDPVFPMLFEFVGSSPYWDAAHHEAFIDRMKQAEQAVPINVFWLVAYPFAAAVGLYPKFESGRTGFGPFVLFVLPFAVAGLCRFRHRLMASPLFSIAAIVTVFYVLWYVTGSSQRVRHLLPVYPLLLICIMVAAHRWARATKNVAPLAAAVFLASGLQLAGQGIFSINYARYTFGEESREAFLMRNVRAYSPVPWINAHLKKTDRLFLYNRQLIYLIDVPTFYGHELDDALINDLQSADDPARLLGQFRAQGVTHLLVSPPRNDADPMRGDTLWQALVEPGCLVHRRDFTTLLISSRTLAPGRDRHESVISLYELSRNGCRLYS